MLSKVLRSFSILAALTVAAQADGLVTEVKVRQQGDAVQIVIPASAAVQHRAKTLGKSVVVDLFPAKLGSAIKADYAINRGLVSGVHLRQCGDHRVRITIDTLATPTHQLTERAGSKGLVIAVSAMKPVTDAQSRHRMLKRVNCRFDNADLGDVVKFLAKEMGRNLYIGPGVKGSVTMELHRVPAEGALWLILAMQQIEYGYKLVEPNTLLVDKIPYCSADCDAVFGFSTIGTTLPKNAIREEILLKATPAPKVIPFLASQVRGVTFTPHPTKNGFSVVGSRRDVRDTKSLVESLDQARLPLRRRVVTNSSLDLFKIKELLAKSVPEVGCTVDLDNNWLILEGQLQGIERAEEMLEKQVSGRTWFTSTSEDESRSSPP